MVQTVITDGGIVKEPVHYFNQNESVYRKIAGKLDATREGYLDADRETRLRLLFDATTYALLTANVPLPMADRAFNVYLDHYPDPDRDSLASDLQENGVGMFNYKSGYITDNYPIDSDVFVDVDELLVSGRDDEAQDRLLDAAGVGPAKSAFTLAMLGWNEHACIDTHVAQYFGIDQRMYDNYSADQYKELVSEIFDRIPELANEISPFLLQWIVFDIHRGQIETHDNWFEYVDQLLG